MTGPDPRHDDARRDRDASNGKAGTPPSVGDLLSDLVRDLSSLFRGETRLVRAEIAEAGQRVATGVEMMAAGGMFLLAAVLVLVQAGIIALAHYVGPVWAAVIVGVAMGLIGVVLILRGRHVVKATRLVPERALEQSSRDIRLAKEQL